MSPHELTFDSIEMLYLALPEVLLDPSEHHEYLRNLNNYLLVARQESELYHRSVVESRAVHGPSVDLVQSYSPGDLVLFLPNARSKLHKLMPQLLGPYRVVSQINAEVTCRQIATGVVKVFHNSRLVLYTGPDDQTAFDLACRDDDQYRVKAILGYRGDPTSGRRYCTFLLLYADDDQSWVQFGPDLSSTEVFETYCNSKPELRILLMPTIRAVAMLQQYRQTPIPASFIDAEFFLDLRALSFTWYDSLQLPDSDTTTYVILARMQKYTNKKHTRADVSLPLFKEILRNVDAYWFFAWGHRTTLVGVTLVDDLFLQRYPQVLDASADVALTHDDGYPPVFA